jgi:hypothetical protein
MTLENIDQYHERVGHTAPRVTLKDLNDNIIGEHYFTALDGRNGAIAANTFVGREFVREGNPDLIPLGLLTICVLVLRNGFTILGKSAPASPENFDPQKGIDLAREDAVKQIWPLMGYALKEKLGHAV